jgi:hypothetical protein
MAQNHNITVDQGATFSLVVTWKNPNGTPIDLTGYTARMQARAKYDSPNPPLFSLTSTPAAGLVLGGVAGTVTITIDAATTAGLVPGQYVYDLEVVSSGGIVTRLIEGRCIVSPEVTK